MLSSRSSVVTNTPVMESAGLSVARAFLDLVRSPMSVDAVEATMSRSWISGGKSLNLRTEWWGAFSAPKGSIGSEIFWKEKDEGGVRVMILYTDEGADSSLEV